MKNNFGFARIKAVIFDCDGTLIDSDYTHYLGLRLALQEMGHDLPIEDYLQYTGKPDSTVAMHFAEKIGEDCSSLIVQKKRAHYLKLSHSGLPAIEPTVNFLKSLAKEKQRLGIKIGVCSAAKKDEVVSHLRNLGVIDLLDIILSGEDDLADYTDPEGVNKPKPYIYQHAMKKLGVFPGQCVVIEDSVPGIAAGVSAGCLTIAVPNEYTRSQDLSHAHLLLESFKNIDVERFFEIVKDANQIIAHKITHLLHGSANEKEGP